MRISERTLGAASVAIALILLCVMGIALGALGGVGVWIVAVLGGAMIGIIVALAAVALLGASKSLQAYEREAFVDPVTALPNSDKLSADLGKALTDGGESARLVLSLYLLDGLKNYNDAYGRACGDALLSWLGRKVRDAVAGRGTVYRLSGGECVVLAGGTEEHTAAVRTAACAALVEVGEGFVISASVGEAVIAEEAHTIGEALKLADHRAHAHRRAIQGATDHQPPAEAIGASVPDSRFDASELATTVGRQMGIPSDQLDVLAAAAHLRDIGNMAVPSVVRTDTGELRADEWQFIRLHTLVGERLLAANFGMEEVATLVRSSHERFDGAGYPDGLRGHEIPLGSRIVFVSSAFEDMTAARPHREALDVQAALAELDRGAGTQFDPEVVRAFREAFTASKDRERSSLPATSHPRMLVLVADDDAASRFLLRSAVEAAGHQCITVQDGRQAWETYCQELPDVVISDSRLPELDGDELCRRIREQTDAKPTYFVMVTALGDLGRIRRGIGSGADDFLTKPIVRQELEMRLIAAARAAALHNKAQKRLAS
jgi:diguanylate cyclase (GGDEF)-like protein